MCVMHSLRIPHGPLMFGIELDKHSMRVHPEKASDAVRSRLGRVSDAAHCHGDTRFSSPLAMRYYTELGSTHHATYSIMDITLILFASENADAATPDTSPGKNDALEYLAMQRAMTTATQLTTLP